MMSCYFFIKILYPLKIKWIDDVFAYHLWKAEDPTGYKSRYHGEENFGYIADVRCLV